MKLIFNLLETSSNTFELSCKWALKSKKYFSLLLSMNWLNNACGQSDAFFSYASLTMNASQNFAWFTTNLDTCDAFRFIIITLLDKKFICNAIRRAFLMQNSACLTQSSFYILKINIYLTLNCFITVLYYRILSCNFERHHWNTVVYFASRLIFPRYFLNERERKCLKFFSLRLSSIWIVPNCLFSRSFNCS